MIPESFSTYFKSLDKESRQAIVDELLAILRSSASDSLNALSADVSDQYLYCCPLCQSKDIRANGKYKSVQRYHCKSCNKYFRQTTGTVTFGLKKPELFKQYLYHMLQGYSIAECGKRTGICIQTSFDWRHKVLSSFEKAVPMGFEGITESDDIFFLESEKGSKQLPRKARKRGSKASKRGISDEQIAVVVTCDRSENKELRVATRGRISKQDLVEIFEDKLDGIETLCTDSHSSYTAFAKAKGLEHKKFVASKGKRVKDKIYHVQNVNNVAKRLRQWMRPFNGVSTKYLQNYLNWFMILERIKHSTQRFNQFIGYATSSQVAWQIWKTNLKSAI